MKSSILLASAAIGAFIIATPAFAQSGATTPDAEAAPQTAPQATAQADDSQLGDIIVTAQRREETSQRAAVAIDVVAPAQLRNAGTITATQLNAMVPSLYVTRAGGVNTSFFIRGVSNFNNNGYSDPAIAFNVDGVYYGRPTSTTGTFYDLDRIEVLKRPQGTLYGRNATGGAINVIPTKPKPGAFSGYVTGGYARFDTYDVEGAVNIPLGDNGAFRVSGKLVNGKGFNRDGTSDEVGEAFRVQMLGELTQNLSVRVAVDYSHAGGIGTGSTFNGREQFTPGSPATATSPASYSYIPSGLDPAASIDTSPVRIRKLPKPMAAYPSTTKPIASKIIDPIATRAAPTRSISRPQTGDAMAAANVPISGPSDACPRDQPNASLTGFRKMPSE